MLPIPLLVEAPLAPRSIWCKRYAVIRAQPIGTHPVGVVLTPAPLLCRLDIGRVSEDHLRIDKYVHELSLELEMLYRNAIRKAME